MCDYSEENISNLVLNPKTRRVVENRNVTFIETSSHLLFPAYEALSVARSGAAIVGSRRGHSGQRLHFIRRLTAGCKRLHLCVVDSTANVPANHKYTSRVSADPQVQGSVDQTRDLTRRDVLTPAVPSPRAASTAEPLPGATEEPLSRGASPPSEGGASPETGGFRRPPGRLQRKEGPLYAT